MKLRRFIVPHREYPICPSAQAAQGALAIYVEGQQKHDAEQMLFGLSILRSVSEGEMQSALATFAHRPPLTSSDEPVRLALASRSYRSRSRARSSSCA